MRCAAVVRSLFVAALTFSLGSGLHENAGAWQLSPLAEESAPALEETPTEAPALLTPDARSEAEEEAAGEADGASFPETPPPPPSPPVAAREGEANDTDAAVDTAPLAGFRAAGAANRLDADRTHASEFTPAAFRGVTPGKTSLDEVIREWGEPAERTAEGERETLRYAAAPFARIEVDVDGGVVASVVGHLREPATLSAVSAMFDLGESAPAAIYDANGQVLGQVYPERGVLVGLTARDGESLAAQVAVEPIAAEGFVLRAEQQRHRQPQRSLADVQAALRLGPQSTRPAAIAAEIMLHAGNADEALAAAAAAMKEHQGDASLRLARAAALLALGRFEEAGREAEHVLKSKDASLVQSARANLLLGDIAADGPDRDVRKAMEHHQEAAQQAAAAFAPSSGEPRHEAAEAAIESDLAIARDLAAGKWRGRGAAFAQWIEHAEQLAGSLPAESQDEQRFRIECVALSAGAAIKDHFDAAPYAAAANERAVQLLAGAADPWRRAEVQWRLGESLFTAADSLHSAGKHELARGYAQDALRLLEAARPHRGVGGDGEYLLGRVYFFIGVDQAVANRDHRAAATWYDKAAACWAKPLPPARQRDAGLHGERLVSMGVSYWHIDEREKGVALTEQGLRLMQQAVERGSLPRTALAVPFNNLASMNRALGNEQQADQYQTRLVDFQEPTEKDE
jgi:tetratricopeptide (TPR) repeat protein